MLTDTFLIALKQKYLDAITQYNKGAAFEKREWEFLSKAGRVEVNVSRGGLFEKACVSTIHATVVIPGRDYQSTIQWVGIQTFPANPQIPIFMGVFEHVSEQGLERCPGFFDVFPTIAYEEDRQFVKQKLEAVMKKHGRTYQGLREGYLKMFQLKEAGSGIGYGVGIAFGPEEENAPYFEDTAQEIFTAYFNLVDKRKDQKPSAEDVEKMQKQRREWVRYTFMENRFFQGGVKLGVPPEAFMTHMLPPPVSF
jgi:coproporphyrinogen III oxidase